MELLRFRDRPVQAHKDAIDEGIKYMEEYKNPQKMADADWGINGFVVTPLRPDDVALGAVLTGTIPSATLGAWLVNMAANAGTGWQLGVVHRVLQEQYYFIFTGIRKGTASQITEVRFRLDGKETSVINVEDIQNWEEGLGYFTTPVAIQPEKTLDIDARSNVSPGLAADPLQFLGFAIKLAPQARGLQVLV